MSEYGLFAFFVLVSEHVRSLNLHIYGLVAPLLSPREVNFDALAVETLNQPLLLSLMHQNKVGFFNNFCALLLQMRMLDDTCEVPHIPLTEEGTRHIPDL